MKRMCAKSVLCALLATIASGFWGQCDPEELPVEYFIGGGSAISEISWQLNDAFGNNILSGGGALAAGQVCLAEGVYTFSGTDSYGDGWNEASGNFYLSGNLIGSYVMNVYDCYYAGRKLSCAGCTPTSLLKSALISVVQTLRFATMTSMPRRTMGHAQLDCLLVCGG